MKNINRNIFFNQIGFGFSAAALICSYVICLCCVSAPSVLCAFICCTVCIFTSLKSKNGISAPDIFLAVPMIWIFSICSPISACICMGLGALLFKCATLIPQRLKIPDEVCAGVVLGLALGVTVLFTNSYFGIGANGETPLLMLKSYRSLGFHPNFRGLLYGTVTLFTMITYPFKFKKLSRYIPPEFATILLPTLLNIFLNPQKEYTTVNEVDFLSISETVQNIPRYFSQMTFSEIPSIIAGAFAVGLIYFVFSRTAQQNAKGSTVVAQTLSGFLTGIPIKKFPSRGYSKTSSVFAFILAVFILLIFPQSFSRLPLHCAGAMLIVSAWHGVPFKKIGNVFKKRKPFGIAVFVLCAVSFIMTNVFYATLVCAVITVGYNTVPYFFKKRSAENER